MDDSSAKLVKVTIKKCFKWDTESNILLCREVVAHRPQNPQQWGKVAGVISSHIKKKNPGVDITPRNCREHTNLLMDHHRKNNAKALKLQVP